MLKLQYFTQSVITPTCFYLDDLQEFTEHQKSVYKNISGFLNTLKPVRTMSVVPC
jgi:hypothetical protein